MGDIAGDKAGVARSHRGVGDIMGDIMGNKLGDRQGDKVRD